MKVEFRCINEQRIIGSIAAPDTRGYQLTARAVWQGFNPADADYQLPTRAQKDGQYFACPRCGGHVEAVGAEHAVREAPPRGPRGPAISREEARRRIIAQEQARDPHPKHGPPHEFVDSAGRSAPSGHPIILGATTIKGGA
jgi:hypothetical protein